LKKNQFYIQKLATPVEFLFINDSYGTENVDLLINGQPRLFIARDKKLKPFQKEFIGEYE